MGSGESGGWIVPHRSRDRSEIAPTRGCVIKPKISKMRGQKWRGPDNGPASQTRDICAFDRPRERRYGVPAN